MRSIFLPVLPQVLHAVADGLHLCRFLEGLERLAVALASDLACLAPSHRVE